MANLKVSGLDIGTNTLTVDTKGTLLVNGNEVSGSGGGGISYVWPTETERIATTKMKTDEQGIQQDTNIVYKYNGTNWVEYYKTGSKYPEQTGNAGKFLMTTGENVEWSDVDLTDYYTKEDTDGLLDTKQDTLVSGTSIKTINGKSVLGNGDLDLEGLSTLSNPKLNEEVLTEFRHSVSGKPLYTKTINFGILPNATNKFLAHGIIDAEDIKVDTKESYAYYLQEQYPIVWTDTVATAQWRAWTDRTNIGMKTGFNATSIAAYITLQYTKTTDTAESPVRLVGGGKINGPIIGTKEKAQVLVAGTLDLNEGNLFIKTVTSDTTFTLTNISAIPNVVQSFILEITNGGNFIVTWWNNIKWDKGETPELTVNGVDILGFYTSDNGNTWRGVLLSKDSK